MRVVSEWEKRRIKEGVGRSYIYSGVAFVSFEISKRCLASDQSEHVL